MSEDTDGAVAAAADIGVGKLGQDLVNHADEIEYAVALVVLKSGQLMLMEHVVTPFALAGLLAWGVAINNDRLVQALAGPEEAQS